MTTKAESQAMVEALRTLKLPKATKMEVSRAALLARLKRRLAQEDKRLVTSRSAAEKWHGDFYIVDSYNSILKAPVRPAEIARDLDVLMPWETAPEFEKDGVALKAAIRRQTERRDRARTEEMEAIHRALQPKK